MRVQISDDRVQVRLSWWQKALGLLGNVSVPRAAVSEIEVIDDPIAVAMGAGVKVGLRLPWLYFVARTIGLDEVFVVRRHVPALSFAVSDGSRLRRVLVSTPEAAELAGRLREG